MVKWISNPLGKIAEFRNGVNFDSSSFGKGIKVINVSDFKDRMYPDYDSLGELDSNSKWHEDSFLKEGDIVFVRSNGNKNLIGRSIYIKDLPADYRVTFSAFCIRLRFLKSIELEPYFYLYVFKSPLFRALLSQFGNGANINNLNQDILKNIKIPQPDLNIQKQIASLLSNYDDLIENNNQRIQLLEEMAEEIYKEWFVCLRFPGYENIDINDLNRLKLRECLAHYIGGGWGEESPKGKNTIPAHVIRGTDFPDFNKGTLNFNVLRYHTESNLSSRICVPNDIIFEVSGGTESQSLGRTCFISESAINRFDAPIICASFCKLLRINDKIVSPFYINEVLNRMHTTGELKVFQVQSTGISNYQFEDFIEATKILIPPIEVQKKFEDIVSCMYDEVQILGAKNQVLQETRDLLLPRLISGKLSVAHLLDDEKEYNSTEVALNSAAEPETAYKTSI